MSLCSRPPAIASAPMLSFVCRLMLAACVVCVAACQGAPSDRAPDRLSDAAASISAEELHRLTERLASDAFAGRAPASVGEQRVVPYLIDQFQRAGLDPGNGSSYVQDVRLVRQSVAPLEAVRVAGGTGPLRLQHGRDVVVSTPRRANRIVNLTQSDVVFAGYGIVAPEYGWNDYADADVTGKTVVLLAGDPGQATGTPSLFRGTTPTFYGQARYKFAEAARHGAEAALIVHDPRTTGRPWRAVQSRWGRDRFSLANESDAGPHVDLEGWMHADDAVTLFERAGLNFWATNARAASDAFEPVALGLTISTTVSNRTARLFTRNVVAQLPGSERNGETVLFTGHWDHLGRRPDAGGDGVYSGAVDNATGVAGLVELAEAFAQLDPRPERTVVFLATTANEAGLLGARHYAAQPIRSLAKTAAVVNVDELNVLGPTRDVAVIGAGQSELEDWLTDAAQRQGRRVRAATSERRSYFDGDHVPFALRGIPALWLAPGVDHVRRGPDWTQKQRADYVATRWHTPSDAYDPTWDLTGAVDDLRLLFHVGHRAATAPTFPQWTEGSGFAIQKDSK